MSFKSIDINARSQKTGETALHYLCSWWFPFSIHSTFYNNSDLFYHLGNDSLLVQLIEGTLILYKYYIVTPYQYIFPKKQPGQILRLKITPVKLATTFCLTCATLSINTVSLCCEKRNFRRYPNQILKTLVKINKRRSSICCRSLSLILKMVRILTTMVMS